MNLSLMGGQYFFDTQEGGLSGNFDLLASASTKLSDGWTIIPLYKGRYQGTKQVTDLVGGGTLFQEMMEHRAAVRGIYEASPKWRIKPEIGVKWELLKETKDETWGKGLFDYVKENASLEGEYVYNDPFSFRLVYDLYKVNFPNYTSLESQASQSAGARELAGAKTIDSLTNSVTASANFAAFWNSLLEGTLTYAMRVYGDQHVIDEAGQFKTDIRLDKSPLLDAGWRFPRKTESGLKYVPGLTFTLLQNRSNQNSYDAAVGPTYLPRYYDYDKYRIAANFVVYRPVGEKDETLDLGVSLGYARTNYPERPVQNASGQYQSDKIYLNEWLAGISAAYPIAKNFKWKADVQYGNQTSNMAYEKLYTYNFSVWTYMLGFSYEY